MKVGRHVKYLIYQNNQENTILVEIDVSSLGIVTVNLIILKNGATHYHADYVNPKWNRHDEVERIVQIDNHIFYRWN